MNIPNIICPKSPFLEDFHRTNNIPNAQRTAVFADNKLDFCANLNYKSQPFKLRRTQIMTSLPYNADSEWLEKIYECYVSGFELKFPDFSRERGLQILEKIHVNSDIFSKKIGLKIYKVIVFDVSVGGVRIGRFQKSKQKSIHLEQGNTVRLTTDNAYAECVNEDTIYVNYEKLTKVLEPGNTIIFIKSLVNLKVDYVKDNFIYCIIKKGGYIVSEEFVKLIGVPVDSTKSYNIDPLAIDFGVEAKLDVFTIKGAVTKQDILSVVESLEKHERNIFIMPKIDNTLALLNINEIIAVSDGIIIDCPNLLMELPIDKYGLMQKFVIAKCKKEKKPILLLCQIENPLNFSKSEICDIANAVMDGIDGIILSEESTCVESIEFITKICQEAEAATYQKELIYDEVLKITVEEADVALAIGAAKTSLKCKAAAIIIASNGSHMPKLISNFKPRCPIIVVTRHRRSSKFLKLCYGVIVVICRKKFIGNWEGDNLMRINLGTAFGKYMGYLRKSDAIVTVAESEVNLSFDNCIQVHYVHDFNYFNAVNENDVPKNKCPCVKKSYKKTCTLSDCLDVC